VERRIPITRKQHQMFASCYAAIHASQKEITVAASAIMAGEEDDIEKANIVGVDDRHGVFTLVLDVPDIAPPAPLQEISA
jgi:hypothetical protein